MAWGDWVRTYVGAIRRGAADLVSGALAQGRSAASATELLRTTFGRLGAGIINLLVGNVVRHEQRNIRDFQRSGDSNLPGSSYQIVQDIPKNYRYLVVSTFTDPRSGNTVTGSHWIDTDTPATWFELTALARAKTNIMGRDRPGRSAEQEVAAATIEPTFSLGRAQVRLDL